MISHPNNSFRVPRRNLFSNFSPKKRVNAGLYFSLSLSPCLSPSSCHYFLYIIFLPLSPSLILTSPLCDFQVFKKDFFITQPVNLSVKLPQSGALGSPRRIWRKGFHYGNLAELKQVEGRCSTRCT